MSTAGTPSAPDASRPPAKQLTLKLNTVPYDDQSISTVATTKEESSSPVRPSYSPVTPTLSHAALNAKDAPQQWIDEPEPLPVSLDENPDAIALRATISLLQMQRQQTLRDIRKLDKTKHAAICDPEAFVKDLRDGALRKPRQDGIAFDSGGGDDDDDDDDSDGNEGQSGFEEGSKFGQLPNAQNIARCPPIEWTKYHITGEPLDRLHELQKQYPGLTEEALARGVQPRTHQVTAPYRPFVDKLTQPSTPSSERQFDR